MATSAVFSAKINKQLWLEVGADKTVILTLVKYEQHMVRKGKAPRHWPVFRFFYVERKK